MGRPIVFIGIPTFGRVSANWVRHRLRLSSPLGAEVIEAWDERPGIPIDEKRNSLAQMALERGAKNLFFLSDDVLPQSNTMLQLLRRRELGARIVTGMYWEKRTPTAPYVWEEFMKGEPFLDWHLGDYKEVAWAGCDCLMIDTTVFEQLPYPWFDIQYKFKKYQNVPKGTGTTEDLWFFSQAKKAGIKVFCDTGIQCGHEDRESGRVYSLPPDWPQVRPGTEIPRKSDIKIGDIGCGLRSYPHHLEGDVVRIDSNPDVQPDVCCDVRQIPIPDNHFDRVFAAHILEHFHYTQSVFLIREWTRILKPGGEIEIRVPNFAAVIDGFSKGLVDSLDLAILYGETEENNGLHKNVFTPKLLEGALTKAGGLEVCQKRLADYPKDGWEITIIAKKVESESKESIEEIIEEDSNNA